MDFKKFATGLCLFCVVCSTHIFSQNDPLKDSLDLYAKKGDLKTASEFATRLEAQIKKKKGVKSAEYGQAAYDLGNLAFKMNDYPAAEKWLSQSLETRKKALGEEHLDVAHSYTRLGSLRMYLGQYLRSDSLHQKALAIRLKRSGPDDKDVAKSYSSLCQVNGRSGLSKKALEYGLESCRIYKKLGGEESPEYLTNQKQVANVYSDLGNNAEAETIFRNLIAVISRVRGEMDTEIAMLKTNLGTVTYAQGKYRETENLFLEALGMYEPEHPMYLRLCNNLGTLYMDMNDFVQAEKYLGRVISVSKTSIELQPEMHIPLANYGLANLHLGNVKKAELFIKESISIVEKNLGRDNSSYATNLLNLGMVYQASGQLVKATECIHEAHAYFLKTFSEVNYQTNQALVILGNLLLTRQHFGQAEASLISANTISHSLFGKTGPGVSRSWENLGLLYLKTGRFRMADSCFSNALETYIPGFETKNPAFTVLKKNQAISHWLRGKSSKADEEYDHCLKEMFHQIKTTFPILSQYGKEKFYNQNREPLEVYNSFCVERSRQNPAILGKMYDNQLETKALLLNSSAKWKQRIKTSGDKKLFARFSAWEDLQEQINSHLNSSNQADLKKVDSLEAESEKLEKELSARSEHFAKISDKKHYSWKDVQKSLKPGEAAIEIIRFQKFGVRGLAIDSGNLAQKAFRQYGLTDTIWYAALIVLPGKQHPELVLLENGNELEGKQLKYYKICVEKQVQDQSSYNKYWKKINDKLPGINRIYMSADGVFHSINPATLFNPGTKKYLLDEKDIRLITSTKDLLLKSGEDDMNKLAYLFGFPDYQAPHDKSNTLAKAERFAPLPYHISNERSLFSSVKGDILVSELPGTGVEVEQVSDILAGNGWEVQAFTRDKALEQTLKDSFKPGILHIATHGYFQNDSTGEGNPLLRSGLLLTGAAQTLRTGKPENTEDGILTAYEAMNLNLDNTDLVVLSACETGLGQIKNGEGVYGLQRAFKIAGAKSIIMSLWKVDDKATQELMVSFYKHWLSPGPTQPPRREGANATPLSKLVPISHREIGGPGLRSAFLKAQKELKAKYPDPYYWGAFVMVGE